MTTSSPQTNCWTISTDYSSSCIPDLSTITLTSGTGLSYSSGDTITVSGSSCYPSTVQPYSGSYHYNTSTISPLQSGVTIGTVGITSAGEYTFQLPVEWQDCFPDWSKVKKMCEEYPGLKIAFEKFQTTYKLIVDHYDTPEDQRPRP